MQFGLERAREQCMPTAVLPIEEYSLIRWTLTRRPRHPFAHCITLSPRDEWWWPFTVAAYLCVSQILYL